MSSFLPYITGSAGAIVILAIVSYLFFAGKLHSDSEFTRVVKERDEYKAALDTERRTTNETAQAAQIGNRALDVLADLARERSGVHHRELPSPEELSL